MINAELHRAVGVLVMEPSDTLESVDFERLHLLADPYIAEHGKLNGLLIYADAFPGWDSFSALLSHIKFVVDRHVQIRRVAVVADARFQSLLPNVIDLLVDSEVLHFGFERRQEAMAWLSESN